MKVKLAQVISRSANEKDIVKRWRKMGFLNGLKEGGVIERRCAVSYEKMTEYLLDDSKPYLGKYAEVWLYACLRGLLTTKNRINRIVEPEEVIDALNRLTVSNVISHLQENKYKIKSPILNLLNYKKLMDKPILKVLEGVNKDSDYKLYNSIMEDDFEARLTKYATIAVKEEINAKSRLEKLK